MSQYPAATAPPSSSSADSFAFRPFVGAGSPVHRVVQGEWWAGAGEALRVQTLLGSCVSLVLWHPSERAGGLCHYLLPGRQSESGPASGRYGDEAVDLMMRGIREYTQAPWPTFQAYLFGGADAFKMGPNAILAIGHRNVRRGLELAAKHGLVLCGTDTLETFPRNIELDTGTGAVTCRRGLAL